MTETAAAPVAVLTQGPEEALEVTPLEVAVLLVIGGEGPRIGFWLGDMLGARLAIGD